MKARFFKNMAACFVMCLLGFTLNASDQWITVSNHIVDGDSKEGIPYCELSSASFESTQETVVSDYNGYTETFSLRKGGSVLYSASGYISIQRTYNSSVINQEVSMYAE